MLNLRDDISMPNFITVLTHLSLDKMATILQTIFQMHFREFTVLYFDQHVTEVCS